MFLIFYLFLSIINFEVFADVSIQPNKGSVWCESIATITAEKREDGKWMYMIEYEIPESTAYNKKGEKITGPIKQYGLKEEEIPSPQKIKIKYRKDEPIIFEYIEKPKVK